MFIKQINLLKIYPKITFVHTLTVYKSEGEM